MENLSEDRIIKDRLEKLEKLRKLKIDPENALRNTNKKFKDRINYIEDKLKKENKTFEKSNLAKLEKLWNEAKKRLNR